MPQRVRRAALRSRGGLLVAAVLLWLLPRPALATAPEQAPEQAPDAVVATDGAEEASLATLATAAAAAAAGAGGGMLLALPLGVPIIYLGVLGGLPPLLGALPILVGVPLLAALGSGLAFGAFSSGIGPYVVGGLAGAAAGAAMLAVGALVVPSRPESQAELHLGVLALLAVPSIAGALVAAGTAPFFTAGAPFMAGQHRRDLE